MGRAKDSLAGRVRRLGRRLPQPVRALLTHPATHPAGQPTPAAEPGAAARPRADRGRRPGRRGAIPAGRLSDQSRGAVADAAGGRGRRRPHRFRFVRSASAANSASDYDVVAAARAVTERDPRFAVRAVPPGGPAAARAAGAAAAQGEFLAFVAATDTVPRTAYATLVGSLRRSGSDLAAGSVQVLREGRPRRPAWAVLTHDRDRAGQTLADFPLALQDVGLGNKVFRTAFWNAQPTPEPTLKPTPEPRRSRPRTATRRWRRCCGLPASTSSPRSRSSNAGRSSARLPVRPPRPCWLRRSSNPPHSEPGWTSWSRRGDWCAPTPIPPSRPTGSAG